jgi:hypothetical protein
VAVQPRLFPEGGLANPQTNQDGDGLFLKVDKRGGASWNLRPFLMAELPKTTCCGNL